MDSIKVKIEHLKRHEKIPVIQEEKLLQTIEESKRALYKSNTKEKLTYFEFLHIQSKYIKKRWWLSQAGVLVLLWIKLYKTPGQLIYKEIGILIPIFVILAIPELWKNIHSKSWEIENTALYSLRQIYSARLLLFGTVDLLMLSMFIAITNYTMQITLYNIVVQCMLPFNLSCCICFGLLCSKRISSEYIAISLCMIGAALWYQLVLNTGLYATISKLVWLGIVILSTIYFVFMIRKLLKRCMQYGEVDLYGINY